MPYSPRSHKNTSHLLYVHPQIINTRDSSYWKPVKCKLEIHDNKQTEPPIYVYNAHTPNSQTDDFDESTPIHPLTQLRVTVGTNNNNAEFTILDENRTWNRKLISEGNIIRVTAGKESTENLFLFKGRIKKLKPRHIGNQKREFTFIAIGEKAETNNILVTFQRAATSFVYDTDFNVITKPDSEMEAWKLVTELLETNGIMIMKNDSIKNHLNLDLSGISATVNLRILAISFVNVELSAVLDFFSEITGATWDIRDGVFIFEYSKQKHSGIVIKARSNEALTDRADSTSYFTSDNGWDYTESIDKGDGFMTHTSVETIISTKSVANSSDPDTPFHVSTLYRTFLAQQFTALDSRFITIRLVLSRMGDPTGGVNDPEHPIKLIGQIVTDNNNTPTGSIVSQFEIPYEGLTSEPTDVFINNIVVDPSVSSPNTKYWIRIKPIGISRADSIRWHHDNDVSTLGRYSAYAIGDEDEQNPSWKVSDRGVTYLFTVFAKIQRLQIFGDQDSADRYNQTDSKLDITYLEDIESVSKLAQMELSVRSNPVRIYEADNVTIPNGKLFYGGEQVTIIDPVLGLDENENVTATNEEISYDFESVNLGINKVTLKPLGEYLYKIEDLPT